ncbi:hypothetical protein [Methylophaga sp.]|uniref:hypothetical protein n=1 Tax=Methylophaga sp. TaxID=2024840 RepID=UPI001401569D|nr:hypothetical protein [Methylophaga sp.]MTI63258.1 hypothetical protein [Methylophaga sp.]
MPGKIDSNCLTIFEWTPIDIQDLLLLSAVLVALFGGRLWKYWDDKAKRKQIKKALKQFLESLKRDLVRIADERNENTLNPKQKIVFEQTSIAEVGHYFELMCELVFPNLVLLALPKADNSAVIELLDHYKKNIDTASSKGHLTRATVTGLLEMIDSAISELSV